MERIRPSLKKEKSEEFLKHLNSLEDVQQIASVQLNNGVTPPPSTLAIEENHTALQADEALEEQTTEGQAFNSAQEEKQERKALIQKERETQKAKISLQEFLENDGFFQHVLHARHADYERVKKDFPKFLASIPDRKLTGKVQVNANKGVWVISEDNLIWVTTFHVPHGLVNEKPWPSWRCAFRDVLSKADLK